jgi:hypothetical protein
MNGKLLLNRNLFPRAQSFRTLSSLSLEFRYPRERPWMRGVLGMELLPVRMLNVRGDDRARWLFLEEGIGVLLPLWLVSRIWLIRVRFLT